MENSGDLLRRRHVPSTSALKHTLDAASAKPIADKKEVTVNRPPAIQITPREEEEDEEKEEDDGLPTSPIFPSQALPRTTPAKLSTVARMVSHAPSIKRKIEDNRQSLQEGDDTNKRTQGSADLSPRYFSNRKPVNALKYPASQLDVHEQYERNNGHDFRQPPAFPPPRVPFTRGTSRNSVQMGTSFTPQPYQAAPFQVLVSNPPIVPVYPLQSDPISAPTRPTLEGSLGQAHAPPFSSTALPGHASVAQQLGGQSPTWYGRVGQVAYYFWPCKRPRQDDELKFMDNFKVLDFLYFVIQGSSYFTQMQEAQNKLFKIVMAIALLVIACHQIYAYVSPAFKSYSCRFEIPETDCGTLTQWNGQSLFCTRNGVYWDPRIDKRWTLKIDSGVDICHASGCEFRYFEKIRVSSTDPVSGRRVEDTLMRDGDGKCLQRMMLCEDIKSLSSADAMSKYSCAKIGDDVKEYSWWPFF